MAKRLKWGTVEALEEKVNQYFATEAIPSIAGLCLYIDIFKDTWNYYTSPLNKWKNSYRKKREEDAEKTDEEKEAELDEQAENDVFEELLSISPSRFLTGEDNAEDLRIKESVSRVLKKAAMRIEEFNNKMIFTLKNPAGPIFYLKAAFSYNDNIAAKEAMEQFDASTGLKVIISIDTMDTIIGKEDEESLNPSDTKQLENGKD